MVLIMKIDQIQLQRVRLKSAYWPKVMFCFCCFQQSQGLGENK